MRKFKTSAKLRRALKKYSDLEPILDVKTRWSSLAYMIQRFLILIPEMKKVAIDLEFTLNFSAKQIKALETVEKMISPAIGTVKKLSESKSNLLTADIEMKKLIDQIKIIDTNNLLKTKFIENLESRFIARRTIMSDILQYLLQSIFKPSDNQYYTEPSCEVVAEYFSSLCVSDDCLEEKDPDVPVAPIDSTDIDLDSLAKKSKHCEAESILLELQEFQKTFKLPPGLLKLAKSLKSIKPTSTDVERTFSVCGLVLSKSRSRMGSELLSAIIIVKNFYILDLECSQ